MVKGRASSPPSSVVQRPCPPLASLSLASTHLCKPSRPSPLFSLLKRTPSVHTTTTESPAAMEFPPSSPPPSSSIFIHGSEFHSSKEESDIEPDASAVLAHGHSRRQFTGDKAVEMAPSPPVENEEAPDMRENQGLITCGRQRLQQHRIQMSGKVIIPETWGREQQLQEWVSYGIVEDALRPSGLMSARTALVKECQRRGNKATVRRTSPAMSADVEVS